MRYLLDTHVWLWSHDEPGKLSEQVLEIIEGGRDELALSSITIWETMLLHQRGSIDLGPDPRRGIAHYLLEYPVTELPVTNEIAIRSRLVELPHRDPADRFLAATSITHGIPLLTRDARLLASNQIETIPA